jgi:hypothetical protein
MAAKRPPKKGAAAAAAAPNAETVAAHPDSARTSGLPPAPDEAAAPRVEVKGLGIAPGVRRPPTR